MHAAEIEKRCGDVARLVLRNAVLGSTPSTFMPAHATGKKPAARRVLRGSWEDVVC